MEGPKASRQSLNSSAFALEKQRERAVNRRFFAIFTNLPTYSKVADFGDLLIVRVQIPRRQLILRVSPKCLTGTRLGVILQVLPA